MNFSLILFWGIFCIYHLNKTVSYIFSFKAVAISG